MASFSSILVMRVFVVYINMKKQNTSVVHRMSYPHSCLLYMRMCSTHTKMRKIIVTTQVAEPVRQLTTTGEPVANAVCQPTELAYQFLTVIFWHNVRNVI